MKTYKPQRKYDIQTKDLPLKITDECNYTSRQVQKIIKTIRELEKQEHRWEQNWN